MPPQNQPVMNTMSTPAPTEKKVGPIVATLIIVLILIIASLYIVASKVNQPAVPMDNTPAVTAQATDTGGVKPVTSNSTDMNAIQNDLNNSTTGLDNQNF